MFGERPLSIAPLPALWFGLGQSERLAEAVRLVGASRAFLVTDAALRHTGIPDALAKGLRATGIDVEIFDRVVANPTTDTLNAAAEVLRAFGRAAVVAVGGGSSMDVAKGVAIAGVNEGSGRDFDYRNEQPVPALAIIAVPTTSGTGSETNAFGVIDDLETHEKFYVGHESVLPRVAIIDPALTVGLPARATASTGLDALAHAIESLAAKNPNPFATAVALEAASTIATWLPIAVQDGTNLEARSQLALAAHLAGVAFASGTGLGLGHGIAHAVSAATGAVHGEVLAAVLPHLMRSNLDLRDGAYARLGTALGVGDPSRSTRENARAAIDAVATLASRVGAPATLAEQGLVAHQLDLVAVAALRDEVTLNAPAFPTVAEVRAVLDAAF